VTSYDSDERALQGTNRARARSSEAEGTSNLLASGLALAGDALGVTRSRTATLWPTHSGTWVAGTPPLSRSTPPRSWITDPDRCAAVGVLADIGFVTKPEQGIVMLARSRAHAAGVLNGWVTARAKPMARTAGSLIGSPKDEVPFRAGHPQRRPADLSRRPTPRGQEPGRARRAGSGPGGWEQRSAEPGAHGERRYDWTVPTVDAPELPAGRGHWLLVRRQLDPSSLLSWRSTAAPYRT